MTNEHDRILASIPAYVLGSLEPDEVAAVEGHLDSGCATCEGEMLAATRDLEALADTVPAVEASAHMRARLMSEVRTIPGPAAVDSPTAETGWSDARPDGRSDRRSGGRPGWLPWAAAAMLALLVWSASAQYRLRQEVDRLALERGQVSAELARLEQDLDQARRHLQRNALASRIVASPNMRAIQLAGLEAAPDASAQALVESSQAKAVLYVSNLAAPGPDQTYQLWIIVGGAPVSAGVFDIDDSGGASLVVENLERASEIEAWAVTLEPAGGVPQPTGPMVLLGAVA